MTTTAREKYEATAVGATAILSPAPRQSDEAFQSDVREIQRMEAEGLVTITKEHRESESGRRLIDLIIFTRLR
jgi:ribosomal protein S19E (S16A)